MSLFRSIAIGCDHGAFALKNELVTFLGTLSTTEGHSVEIHDVGQHDASPADYPDKAKEVCDLVLKGTAEVGIVMCGTGIGISIAANKIPGIRCALCHDHYTGMLCRQHNDANVLSMGARVLGPEVAKDTLMAFLTTEYEGGRHVRRVEKIAALEKGGEDSGSST